MTTSSHAIQQAAPSPDEFVLASSNAPSQYLTFFVNSGTFAIGILSAREIIEYEGLTTVPMMPHAVRGVINVRGAVVPVIDLAVRLGGEPSRITKRTCIVLVETEQEGEVQTIGLMVSAVNQVVELPRDRIEPPPAMGAKIRAEFIEGVGNLDDKFILLLRINNVVSIDEETLLMGNHG